MIRKIVFCFFFFLPILLFSDYGISDSVSDEYYRKHTSHQEAANFFNYQIKKSKNSGSTPILSYDGGGGEDARQTAFYSDGFVVTYLSGKRKGEQIVVYKNKIIGYSFFYTNEGELVIHKYFWGKVVTSYNRQEVTCDFDFLPIIE